MFYIDKSKILIAVLSGILLFLLFFDGGESVRRQKVSAHQKETTEFQELTAPVRQISRPAEGEKICYLTFDDGPSRYTEKVLDILKKYDAKATFFVIGQSLDEETKPVIKRMIGEGHAVGMHADVHSYETLYKDLDSFLKDYESLYTKLRDNYGIDTAIFRFPGGSACSYLRGRGHEFITEMERRGFACFDWKASGEDSVGKPTSSSIQKNVFVTGLKYSRPIVLLHDSAIAGETVEALPGIIERYKKEGYRFESLEHAESYIFPDSRSN